MSRPADSASRLCKGAALPALPRRVGRAFAASARVAAAWLHRHPVAGSLGLAAAITVPTLLFLAPAFGVNDDVAIAATLDGSNYGEPLPHMVFSNVLLGLLLSTLYDRAAAVPWYGVHLAAVQFAALAAALYLVASDERPGRAVRWAGLAAYVGVFGLWSAVGPTFTTAGLLLSVTGVVLYLARGGRSRTAAVAAAAMIGFSSYIRWDSLTAGLALGAPFALGTIRSFPWRRQALAAGAAAGIVLTGFLFQLAYYSGDEAWQEYNDFNRARGNLMERSDWVRDDAVLSTVGWSRNDAAMFSGHFYTDAATFTTEDVEQILGATQEPRSPIASLAGAARSQTDSPEEIAGWALVAVLAAAAFAGGGRRARLFAIAVPAWSAVTAVGLVMFRKLPDRVGMPLIAFAALMLLARPPALMPEAATPASPRRLRLVGITAAVSAGLLAVAGLVLAVRGVDTRREADRRVTATLAALAALDPDGIFISWGTRLDLGSLSPFRAPLIAGPRLIHLGWLQRSPLEAAWLDRLGIDDLYSAVADRDDIYLPLRAGELGRIYLRFLEEHYEFGGLLRPTAQIMGLTVYDLAVEYRLTADQHQLAERRLDGTVAAFPLDAPDVGGRAAVSEQHDGGLAVTGTATTDDGTLPAGLVVLVSGHRGVAVALPAPAGDGAPPPGWFSIAARGPLPQLKLIALWGSRGAVIPLAPAPQPGPAG